MIRIAWIAAILCLSLAVPGLAQRKKGGDSGGGGDFGGGFGAPRADKSAVIAKELKLTKEQIPVVFGIFDAAQKEIAPLAATIRDGRVAITQAHIAGTSPDDAVKKLAAINAHIVKTELDAIAKVVAALDDKQKARSARLFELVDGMFQTQGGWRTSN